MAVGRLIAALRREVISRRLPHGLVHWRYLSAQPPEPLARQRALWRGSVPRLPRPLWAALEVWLWLRWQLWSGPVSVVRSVRRLGSRVREEEGIGLLEQARVVGAVALGYCVPPFEIYRHRLYRRENTTRVAELVFDHTAEAFRRSVNAPGARTQASLHLLADKERQTAELSALGVPMTPILEVVRRGTRTKLEHCLSDAAPVFCKPRHGSAGVGAFSACVVSGVITAQPLDGLERVGEEAEEHWDRLLCDDDMLVQPRLSVHPGIAPAASEDDIVTARFITLRGDDIEPYCATLELPAGRDVASGRCRYVVLAVQADTGAVAPFPEEYLRVDEAERQRAALLGLETPTILHWDAVRELSALAHRQFAGVHAIAWDWAITADGPLLLEGNAGWATTTPQQLHGGLLR